MAKSLRSKIKRRWRALRRKQVERVVDIPNTNTLSQKLFCSIINKQFRVPQPKNAFLYPDDPQAQFPKKKNHQIIDLRSSAIPESGLQWSGAYRKKVQQDDQQKSEMQEQKQQIKVNKVIQRPRERGKKSRRIVKF